ncbi:hypothetical protein FHS21_000853 [Phyllobacterium trifolii]|uniref:Uncharacterized protein n=1 Tax=Phyllobacterium trifolii TaxID=300193 RepID=A0A839U1Y1_9HYPH|nr:hypothetical protein [Phyllobacterium trifolii]
MANLGCQGSSHLDGSTDMAYIPSKMEYPDGRTSIVCAQR